MALYNFIPIFPFLGFGFLIQKHTSIDLAQNASDVILG